MDLKQISAWKKEILFLWACLLIAVISGVGLLISATTSPLSSSEESIATILPSDNGVKLRKLFSGPYWLDIDQTVEAQKGDEVYTNADGSAQIHFKNSPTQLDLQGNSLVKIQNFQDQTPEVDLDFGVLIYRGKKESRIIFAGQQIAGEGVVILSKTDHFSIEKISGDAALSGKGFKPNDITLLSPTPMEKIAFDSDNGVSLQWQSKKIFKNFHVIVGLNHDLDHQGHTWMSSQLSQTVFLNPSHTYYWKVEAQDEDGNTVSSSTSTFQVTKTNSLLALGVSKSNENLECQNNDALLSKASLLPSPTLTQFTKHYDLDYKLEDGNMIQINPPQFSWKHVEQAPYYRVQIFKDKELKHVASDGFTQEPQMTWVQATPGTYYLTVSSLNRDMNSRTPHSSHTFSVSVKPPRRLQVITEAFKMNAAMTSVNLYWEGHPASSKYEVQVAQDSRFSEAKKYFSNFNHVTWKQAGSSTLFARVRSLDQFDKPISPFSSVTNFRVMASKLRFRRPASKSN